MRRLFVFAAAALVCGCHNESGGDEGFEANTPPPPLTDSRTFRAIAGVSMGAYGAMNLGTKHSELFGTIASLGGPIDLTQLLRDAGADNLEVKAQVEIPRQVGDDFTFDHLPPYPDRGTRMTMFQDLVLALGNPFLHHPDPVHQYFAIDSEPAQIGEDDELGTFTAATFTDGGDTNANGLRQLDEVPNLETDVLLLARGSAASLAAGQSAMDVGGRALADLNGDGVFDVGDGIVLNFAEPFTDANDNFVFDPDLGETFSDDGLDGVPATGDFGEGNGVFDYDPDRARWLTEDPLTRVAARSASEIQSQRIYMDVGRSDELGFARHYMRFVSVLEAKGLTVDVVDGLSFNCANLPRLESPYTFTLYDAGHRGIASVDPDDLLDGNVCGEDTIWQRLLAMVGFLNDSFPDGFFGPGGDFEPPDIDFDDLDIDFPDLDPTGDNIDRDIASPALATMPGATGPLRHVVIYRPPAFFHSDETFPVVYFLGGYGQTPEDFRRVGDLLDLLILSGQLQNLFFVFVPGDGGRIGSFYVNHAVSEAEISAMPTSGRYEDSLVEDLIPFIEDALLERRVRR